VALSLRRRGASSALQALALLALLLTTPVVRVQAGGASQAIDTIYPSTSWALGIVVPEGAGLAGGGGLRWEDVSNLTSLVTLPYFRNPSGIVYAVMSVMASDGSVMQVAAGVYPSSGIWLAYSWAVEGITSRPAYSWILNSSVPTMSAGDSISLSILRNSTRWSLRVVDLGSGAEIGRSFPPGIALSLRPGDQEAFALESYSRTAADFEHMGNLTLNGLFADGDRVATGTYVYGGWDPNKNPIFAVGSSGTNPPIFISLQEQNDGRFVWSYASVWLGGTASYGWIIGLFLALGLAGAVAGASAAFLASRRRRRPGQKAAVISFRVVAPVAAV
jgi:hypothetical protein